VDAVDVAGGRREARQAEGARAPADGGPTAGFRPRLRLLAGVGDPERARDLLLPLCAGGDVALVGQCLTADCLLECARAGRGDAALLAADLHRLSSERLESLVRTGVAVVLLAHDPEAPRWTRLPIATVPLDSGTGAVSAALATMLRGERPRRRRGSVGGAGALGDPGDPAATGEWGRATARRPDPGEVHAATAAAGALEPPDAPGAPGPGGTSNPVPAPAGASADAPGRNGGPGATAPPASGFVLAVAGGHGSPGSTTVALNLAVALGAAAPAMLVDAALLAPSVHAALPLDRTRNLVMLAHDDPRTPDDWDRALARETQPLAPRSPTGRALCGVPRPALRPAVSARLLAELVARLRERFRYVVLDLGDVADLPAGDAGVAGAQRAALAAADHVYLVATPDPVGVWRAQEARDALWAGAGVARERTSLVLNRHDGRRHHRRGEIEWALGLRAAAVVPHDHSRVQEALGAQQPVVLDERSAAGRALLDLAERLFGGDLVLPTESPAYGARVRREARDRQRMPWPRRWAGAVRRVLAEEPAGPPAGPALAGLRSWDALTALRRWRPPVDRIQRPEHTPAPDAQLGETGADAGPTGRTGAPEPAGSGPRPAGHPPTEPAADPRGAAAVRDGEE
jgi:MinD-like ATPase involved in chromosome partitioning or flagellar assembly